LIAGFGLIPLTHPTDKEAAMTRDAGLEQLVADDLADVADLTTTKMFGGFAWLWHGHLICAVRHDGILFRLGKGNDVWALDQPDVATMIMGGRPMPGWVRLAGAGMGDDALRARMLAAARTFVATLPAK
jgi:hypothetical protein